VSDRIDIRKKKIYIKNNAYMEKQENIEDKIYKFLESKEQLEDIDETMISELVFNIQLIEQCKHDILTEGYKLNVTMNPKKKPYYVKSQSFNAYQTCLRNINMILTSLGLTVRERQRLKLAITSEIDEFDAIMRS